MQVNSIENPKKSKDEEFANFILNNVEPLKLKENKKVDFEELHNSINAVNIKQKNKSSAKGKLELNKDEKLSPNTQSVMNRKKFMEIRSKDKEKNKKKGKRIKIDLRELVSELEKKENEDLNKNRYKSEDLKILMNNNKTNTGK